ncbi:hypothetical protein ACA910_018412 [Epithemia clementina (nom. ined.)]
MATPSSSQDGNTGTAAGSDGNKDQILVSPQASREVGDNDEDSAVTPTPTILSPPSSTNTTPIAGGGKQPFYSSRRQIFPPAPRVEQMERTAAQSQQPRASSMNETMLRTPLPSSIITAEEQTPRQQNKKLVHSHSDLSSDGLKHAPPSLPSRRIKPYYIRESSLDMTLEHDALDLAIEDMIQEDNKKQQQKQKRQEQQQQQRHSHPMTVEPIKEQPEPVPEPLSGDSRQNSIEADSSSRGGGSNGDDTSLRLSIRSDVSPLTAASSSGGGSPSKNMNSIIQFAPQPHPLPPPPSQPPLSVTSAGNSVHSSESTPTVPTTKKKAPKKEVPRIPAAEDRCIENDDRIRLGICAMAKKARSKPMAEILSRLDESLFCVVFFDDDLILNQPVEEWPICDVLIAFFSKGYPLPKAKEYVKLRKPFIVNDLEMQETLQDRRRVYDLLEESGIDVPRHAYLSRDGYVSKGTGDGNGRREQEIQEFDDHIEINGIVINKPFVEKPVNAEDHNIAIYYPTSAGGGCKKLFRKVGNRSSEFYPYINEVRRDGSYLYEEFVETQGTDVKMYTVGPDYGHAEARKSPTVDGKVERNSDGKELRFPVILTFREKEIARRIVIVFKQFVCGFDILRVQEGHSVVSYVCDVNGWSFVKNSRKYYDDCAQILAEHLLAKMKPAALTTFSTLDPLVTTSLNHLDDEIAESEARPTPPARKFTNILSRATRMLQGEPVSDDAGSNEGAPGDIDAQSQHSCMEYQMHQGSPPRNGMGETGELLSSAAATLIEGALPVREFPNNLTSEPASLVPSATGSVTEKVSDADDYDTDEMEFQRRRRSGSIPTGSSSHQEELRCVLAIVRHGDRTPKQKLKVDMTEPHILEYFHKHCKDCLTDLKVKAKAPLTEFLQTVKTTLRELPPPVPPQHQTETSSDEQHQQHESNRNIRVQLTHMRDILERWKIHGLNRKLQIKPKEWEHYEDPLQRRCTKVQLILKWGGNLTKLGEKQAIALGHKHRHDLYPDAPGGGILRLHSTFRHDLKIKTSDEGRVMKTAAAFSKGLLELEGDLPPILVSLVHKEKGSVHMLDPTGNKEVKNDLDVCKEKITANLQKDIDIASATEEELYQLVGPKELTALREAIQECGNPRKMLMQIHETMGELLKQLEEMLDQMGSGDERLIEGGEGLRGNNEEDVALSGVKLYKGETLLELTERWRFIYDRLYDPETDKFDLSRIPDVHDNVRFDVLHNPHLGLTETLQKLYNYAKIMADCVVPQEYGTTLAEKRDVGVKICHSLLEKIKYDLNVARTDNKVEMRYMINMNYEADLPINTMGRRIRTRLYFTSESHLHTVLNVFRFAQCGSKGLLSEHGTAIVNATRELCYLTQIVMRVFEDNRRGLEDPRRFRVEILFSPGAAATPSHIDEDEREHDASRYGTEPLQVIGRDGLTCAEVEDFFEQAIMAGRSDDEEGYDIASTSTAAERVLMKAKKVKNPDMSDVASVDGHVPPPNLAAVDAATSLQESRVEPPTPTVVTSGADETASRSQTHRTITGKSLDKPAIVGRSISEFSSFRVPSTGSDDSKSKNDAKDNKSRNIQKQQQQQQQPQEKKDKRIDNNAALMRRRLNERKYFWGTVAVASIVLGVSCLVVAFDMAHPGQRRRWPRRFP